MPAGADVREVILDHYKNPRGHGTIEGADAHAEGMNPLCGDKVDIYVSFDDDGETIHEVKFSGRGCAISQAATSMLMEMVEGRKAAEVAAISKDELLEEVGIPLTPVRLKCALLGLGGAQGRAPPREGHAAPRGVGRARRARAALASPAPWPRSTSARSTSCPRAR